jgi:ubiquinone/menaquinone biosynthesis C-methylase UbiE
MSINFGPGFHAPGYQPFDADAYEQYIGRWSRLFVPAVLNAAEVAAGDRALDVATGPGEATLIALSLVGPEGLVIGSYLSPSMLWVAKKRAVHELFIAVAADGQALPFGDGSFDAVICQLGLQFFPDPTQGVREFRRVVRSGGRPAVCVITAPDRTPMWGVLADVVGRCFPDQRDMLGLSFLCPILSS